MKKISELNLNFSIIIAVFQRENELSELLESLTIQTDKDFEVIVVDDGSPEKLQSVAEEFKLKLNLKYFYKSNSGPGKSRNFGMEKASGNYFIFLDSDTIVPNDYISIVRENLEKNYTDAYGGPDAAAEDFTDLQKAISFSMTSFLTTGGIRGGKRQIGKFQPRSFNMGISKKAFEKTGGFGELRIGEDPDLSMTLWENGFETQLIQEAKVYHKRRTSLKKFAKQVYQFGAARPILNQRHPKYKKLTFWFPTLFLVYFSFCLFGILFSFFRVGYFNFEKINLTLSSYEVMMILISPLQIYFFMIFIFSGIENKSVKIGFLSMLTTIIQHISYGYGFLKSWLFVGLIGIPPKKLFPSHFY